MSLSGISSSKAVLAAVREYDDIGRDAFLRKYGFGPAKTYFLYFQGRYYDSKAIIGVAHGYQFPDQGILHASEFSGGEDTVQQKLEKLGFEVRKLPGNRLKFYGVVEVTPTVENWLQVTPPPIINPHEGTTTRAFKGRKIPDRSVIEAKNKELGLCGEYLVVEYERNLLIAAGRPDLAAMIRHVSEIEGDGTGYDIYSSTADGCGKYIEVKTTAGPANTAFFMTSNEVEFSRLHSENYYLYRVYNYSELNNSGCVFIVRGSVEESFALTTSEYRVTYPHSSADEVPNYERLTATDFE